MMNDELTGTASDSKGLSDCGVFIVRGKMPHPEILFIELGKKRERIMNYKLLVG